MIDVLGGSGSGDPILPLYSSGMNFLALVRMINLVMFNCKMASRRRSASREMHLANPECYTALQTGLKDLKSFQTNVYLLMVEYLTLGGFLHDFELVRCLTCSV